MISGKLATKMELKINSPDRIGSEPNELASRPTKDFQSVHQAEENELLTMELGKEKPVSVDWDRI